MPITEMTTPPHHDVSVIVHAHPATTWTVAAPDYPRPTVILSARDMLAPVDGDPDGTPSRTASVVTIRTPSPRTEILTPPTAVTIRPGWSVDVMTDGVGFLSVDMRDRDGITVATIRVPGDVTIRRVT